MMKLLEKYEKYENYEKYEKYENMNMKKWENEMNYSCSSTILSLIYAQCMMFKSNFARLSCHCC